MNLSSDALTLINPEYPHEELREISNDRFETLNYLKHSFSNFKNRPYRDTQIMALDFIVKSKKKFIVIEAPTGSGKSLMGMAASQLYDKTIYTVHSKPLQVQLQRDFPEAAILFGKSNYPCLRNSELNVAECPLIFPSTCKYNCTYKHAKQVALNANFKVLNYAYLLTEINHVRRFSHQNLIVIDEADSLESILYNFVSIAIKESTIKSVFSYLPEEMEEKEVVTESLVSDWIDWGHEVDERIKRKVQKLQERLAGVTVISTDDEKTIVKQLENYNNILSKLDIFLKNVDRTWQVEIKKDYYDNKTVHFKPVWLNANLTGPSLWSHSDHFLLMSATFPPLHILSKMLGITPDEIDYLTLPSTFPVTNRRCILSPVANITHWTQEAETPKIIQAIRTILTKHPGEKGLIHTVNYNLRDSIMKDIKDIRLITHDRLNKQSILDHFRTTTFPLVLVSPSSERGISLEDAQCRFIIVAKAPYLSLNDRGVKARQNSGPMGEQWFDSDMLLTMVQAVGRGVRHEEDYCIAYLLDMQISKKIKKNPSFLPPWFRESLEYIDPKELFRTKKG